MNRNCRYSSLIAGLLMLVPVPAFADSPRPNFLFVYTDDQRFDAMSVVQREQGDKARFPWLKTPHMDRLAAEGMRFRNAFVVNSLCAPSRASYLTGRYGHTNGIVNNHTPFAANSVTHASLLRAAGYKTGYVGKWHMGGQSGQRPGFDFSASFVGQGRYVDCPVEVNGKSTPTKGWVDDVSTDFALKFIDENKSGPFCLTVGFKATHGPFDPPPRRKDDYAGERARPVPNLRSTAIYRPEAQAKATEPLPDPLPTNLNYFRCITAADDNLGRLLQKLDDLKLADNTVVVFASDNGYYLGEHGLGDKRSAYDESLRIPLLVRYPKLAGKGKSVDEIALNVDLAPTFLDFAGVPIPKEMHGRSWRPLLEGKSADWRKAFFYCYFYENNFRTTPTVTAVRTETAKLVKYLGHDDWTEVFDLAKDPYEIRNLVNEPEAAVLRRQLEEEYARQSKAIDFRIPDFADKQDTDQPKAALKDYVLVYRFGKDSGAKVVDESAHRNDGTAKGSVLVDGRAGGKARRFDGQGHIDVPKTKSLDPAVLGWTVEVVCKTEQPDGVLVARGGQSNGYCLYLDEGRPTFVVRARSQASRVAAKESIVGKWTSVTARATSNQQLVLQVDGKEAARGKLSDFLRQDPADGMQIGADLGSQVLEGKKMPPFTGLIESVRVYSGDAPQASVGKAPARPNILWLIAEDFGNHLSCCGTKEVWTPNLDQLAKDGVRYPRFFTVAPVCSPSRSAFMTGMYQTTIGAHNHRSHRDDGYQLPSGVRVITEWFRDGGYYTANVRDLPPSMGFKGTAKTDWNFTPPAKPFDTQKWTDLAGHQPFFAQVNFQETHRKFHAPAKADPAKVEIPPYEPDHKITRADRAAYLDATTELDRKVGLILKQLATDGLADNTIVVFFGDNGQAHIRGKQFCYEEGLNVPLIIRWPKNLPAPKHFQPGVLDGRLLASIDLAPTMLALAGIAKPPKMEGEIFLGDQAGEPRKYVFGARDRCDETVFRFRTVRDDRYRYIRNFTPERPFLQKNDYKERSYPVWNLLKELHAAGQLTPIQERLCAASMPEEELYNIEKDPHQIDNLAPKPEHRGVRDNLRKALERWIEESNDQGKELEPPELAKQKGVTKPGTPPNKGYDLAPGK